MLLPLRPGPVSYTHLEAPYVYKMARELGIKFNQVMTVDNDYGNLSMISQNLGFGIYPRMIAENLSLIHI